MMYYTAAIWSYLYLGPYFCRMGILYLNYNRAIIGPPAKSHLNGVSTACPWWSNIECWRGSFVIFRGSGQVLLIHLIFQGRPGPPAPPPLWICACHQFIKEHLKRIFSLPCLRMWIWCEIVLLFRFTDDELYRKINISLKDRCPTVCVTFEGIYR